MSEISDSAGSGALARSKQVSPEHAQGPAVPDRRFEKIIIFFFILVFLISFTYKFGGYYYYDMVPWIFFTAMIAALVSVVGVLVFPLAIMYQTLFYYKLTFIPIAFTTLYFLVAAFMLAFAVSLGKEKIKKDANLYIIIVFGIIAFISTLLNGYNIGFGNSEFTHYMEGILAFLVITVFAGTKKRMRMFSWLLLLAVASLAFRLYNHTYTYDFAMPGFENNYLARVLAFYVPFLLGLFWAEKKTYLKYLVLIAFLFTAQSITQLGSRATYLSLGVALPLMFLSNLDKKSTWGILGLGMVFILFFASPVLISDIKSIPLALQGTESEDSSIQGRALAAEFGWDMFRQSPLIGYGIYPSLFENMMLKKYDWYKSGHNSYVILAVETGIFGLIAYILLFAVSIYYCYKARILFRNKDDYLYNISQGTMFGMIAIGINQYMINNPWIPTVFIGFGLSSALYYIAGKYRESHDAEQKDITSPQKSQSSP